jgi:uncharacterized Zn-binding protein involved in type VI secretion
VFIKAAGNGGITIDGGEGNVSIKGATIAIQSTKDLNLTSAQNMHLESAQDFKTEALNVRLNAKVSTTLNSTASTTIATTGQTSITSAVLMLNGGGKPAARVTDIVAVNGASGSIIKGSTTVFIGGD